jgi:hypothetical protein
MEPGIKRRAQLPSSKVRSNEDQSYRQQKLRQNNSGNQSSLDR